MGYLKIPNLYSKKHILNCFALEKVEGTSAHISFKNGQVTYFSGGADHNNFTLLFPANILDTFKEVFAEMVNEQGEYPEVTFHGEAHGGKIQGMSKHYGKDLKFIVFDVKKNGKWLNVPYAEELTLKMGLKFVPYEMGPLTEEWLDAQRDAPSKISLTDDAPKEGIVIRAIYENNYEDGYRFIYKHKTPQFRETNSVRSIKTTDEDVKLWVDAEKVAEEYVVPMRLSHVLQKTEYKGVEDTGNVVRAMVNDILVEEGHDIVWNKKVEKAIGKRTVELLRSVVVEIK